MRSAAASAPKVAAVVASSTMVALLCCGVAQATTVRVASQHKTSGTVRAINGASASGTCGVQGTPGSFTLTSQSTSYTVDVGVPSTTFKDRAVSAPSFADVCAGDQVRALGAVSANDVVTATEVIVIPPRLQQVTGTVGSVNGSSTQGTCGAPGTAGNFGLTSPGKAYTVEVGENTTTFKDRAVSAPSFAIVCVGDKARAVGTIANGVLNAVAVTVIPPHPQQVIGTVESVNGSSSQGVCGAPGSSGTFNLSSHDVTYVVNVGATATSFKDRAVNAPSFAIVCVGDKARALGALANHVVTASVVTVIPPRPRKVSGIVESVNGVSSQGVCGARHTAGEFVVETPENATDMVEVGASSTAFHEQGVTAPSFAIVCVGAKVRAVGTIANDIVTATDVTVIPPKPKQVSGTVASVNGSMSCGKSGTAGTFVLTGRGSAYTVDVGDPSTIFEEQGVNAPSFAIVCSGDKVKARGTLSNTGVLTANSVLVIPNSK